MTSLNVVCDVCNEYYKSNDFIYTTGCGHLFHRTCLFRRLQTSYTCPQCSVGCLRQQCYRVYFKWIGQSTDDTSHLLLPNIEVESTNPYKTKYPSKYMWLFVQHDFNDDLCQQIGLYLDINEDNGYAMYAARVYYKGDMIPGVYCPQSKGVHIVCGSKCHLLTENIEILDISNDDAVYKWIRSSYDERPENALVSGNAIMGNEPLYMVRIIHKGKVLYGKLHLRNKMAYAPFRGKEIWKYNYEVLVRLPRNCL
ncbi:uncharacterized protein LOC105261491 [Musca domestica]|uniref:Uncharacterized protein LOC105261491 n=1 Tax=Musca domestica TaxID=7370 RepID=A0ABM3VM77_MUSDO|nr:uncharacterized protein LOC105261491 [Musca domestica]